MTKRTEESVFSDDEHNEAIDRYFDLMREKAMRQRPADLQAFVMENARTVATELRYSSCEPIPNAVSPLLTERALSVIILGASGDLARKKTLPALFQLYCRGLLPKHVNIIGYARSKVENLDEWRQNLLKTFTRMNIFGCHADAFLERITYLSGSYEDINDFERLRAYIEEREKAAPGPGGKPGGNRLFYLALPPTVFVPACTGVRKGAMQNPEIGWTRVVIEKPFGRDTETSAELSQQLGSLFEEAQVFRIDHYLGKEMVQNIASTRFANRVFSALWNSDNIDCVRITFKEQIGTEGRGGYFDAFGIIRDVVQNHLTQILSLIAMEHPRSLAAEDIRDAKVAVLRCIAPIQPADCVIGQYTASEDKSIPGYLEDPTVPRGSVCPTYAVMRLHIQNDRWKGVPFIIKAGKALETRFAGIRIQFKKEIHPFGDATQCNELVIRAQPSEAMYINLNLKTPGFVQDIHKTDLDLTYAQRYDATLPDAYETLIHEALLGNNANFVRRDELDAAWRIYSPLLKAIDRGELKPLPYAAGSRGPKEADQFILDSGYKME